jgi:elongation factor 2
MPPKFTLPELQSLMSKTEQIRNVSIIAHVDHGKSTVADAFIAASGLISADAVGKCVLDSSEQSKSKGITIKSTGNSLVFEHPSSSNNGQHYLINLIDSPGHVDFSSEVTAALRICDGCLVVIDCIESVCVQTETVLRQAMAEKVKPILLLNKLDRAFLELQMTPEEAYQNFRKAIESVNVIVAPFESEEDQDDNKNDVGKLQMDPSHGNVAFGSGLQQWAFTIQRFAKIYADKFGVNVEEMSNKLWGDYFLDQENKTWISNNADKCLADGLQRAFVQFCLEPIHQLIEAAMQGKIKKLDKMLKTLGVIIKQQDLETLTGKDLVKFILPKWLPFTESLLDVLVIHLPSPIQAQRYRSQVIYDGPTDDVASQAISTCDKDGPLMVFISKMVPNSDYSRFYAFGRVFSGTLKKSESVTILRPNYEPGKKHDMDTGVKIGHVSVMVGKKIEGLEFVPAGNNVLISGIDHYLVKSGTITTIPDAYCFKSMKYSVSPVVRVAVATKIPSDLPKLVEGLKKLSKSDPLVVCSQEESGEHIVAGAGELHLEIVLHDLQELFLNNIPLKISEPVVSYRETIRKESSIMALAKSPNNLNRLFAMAKPTPSGLTEAIDRKDVQPQDDYKTRGRVLADEYGLDITEARKLWSFGPDENGPNLLFDATRSVSYLSEIKDSIVAGFQWATKEGPLCEEPMRGVMVRLLDAQIHRDQAHRGTAQILPTARRVSYGSFLLASPFIQEPFFECNISTIKTEVGPIYECMARRRGVVVDEVSVVGSPVVMMKFHIPVASAFGLTETLRSVTSGRAFPQCSFSHWGDCASEVEMASIIAKIRTRKGLEGDSMPDVDKYNDRL